MKIACLSLVEIFPDYVLGGSQNILRKIILGLRENNINVRLFSPKNDNPKSFIGDVEIENKLSLKGSFPSPFEIPLYELQSLQEELDKISSWADRLYFHGDGWFMRNEFVDSTTISGIHDLVYQESVTSVMFSESDKIIVPSNYLRDTIKSSLSNEKFNQTNISVIKNSIDNFSKSIKINDSISNDNLILLFPHRPDIRKGLNNAIKISLEFIHTKNWNSVTLKVPKFNENLDKDEKNSSYINQELKNEFISSGGNILFHDWIPLNKMSDYYKSGDLTLCPGNFIESFGLVPLESLSNGTPAICSSVGAFREFDGFDGLKVIPYGDTKSFVKKGLELLSSKDEILAGRERVILNYDLNSMIDHYIEVFTNPSFKENYKSNTNQFYAKIDGKNYDLSPWCFINNNKIYHDYKGWLDSFENKFKIIDKEIFFVDNISQKALDEKILISS